jgi:hypothetical protein
MNEIPGKATGQGKGKGKLEQYRQNTKKIKATGQG